MKRFIIALMVLAMAASAMAENPVAKGMLFMDGAWTGNFAIKGGDLNKGMVYNEETNTFEEGDSPTYLQLNPSLGYFIANGIGIGATVMFENYSQGDYKENGFGAGPRILWFPTAANADEPKGKILPMVAASFLFTSEKVEFGPNDEIKVSGYAARLSGGGVWMLTNGFGVHGEVYFELQNAKTTVTDDEGEFEGDGVSGNEFGIMLGVLGFFGTAK